MENSTRLRGSTAPPADTVLAVPTRILRRPAVQTVTGLSRSSIYDLMSKGLFPRPIKLTGKAVGWTERAIMDWLDSRERASV